MLLDWKLGSGTFFFLNESHLKSSLVDTENELGHHHFRVVEDLGDEAVCFGTQRRDVLKHVMAHERRLLKETKQQCKAYIPLQRETDCVGSGPQHERFALLIPTCWYLKSLADPTPTLEYPTPTTVDPTRASGI